MLKGDIEKKSREFEIYRKVLINDIKVFDLATALARSQKSLLAFLEFFALVAPEKKLLAGKLFLCNVGQQAKAVSSKSYNRLMYYLRLTSATSPNANTAIVYF